MAEASRAGATIVAGVHLAGAIGWWVAMAGGFPPLHPMSVANRWIPGVVIVVAVAVIAGRRAWASPGATALASVWLGLAGCGALLFNYSMGAVWAGCLMMGVVGLLLAGWPRRRTWTALAAGVGVGMPDAARG